MRPILIKFLGYFEARLPSGAFWELETQKAKAMMGYLALCPRLTSSRDSVANLLWSEVPSSKSRHCLRQTLFMLRKHIKNSDDFIHSDRRYVALNSEMFQFDILDFLKLAESSDIQDVMLAIRIYRGEFLEGVGVVDYRFAEWLADRRQELNTKFVNMLEFSLNYMIENNRYEEAMDFAKRIVSREPYREDIHRMLMRILIAQGRSSAALNQYYLCASILRNELGVDPEEETREVYSDILENRHKRLSDRYRNKLQEVISQNRFEAQV